MKAYALFAFDKYYPEGGVNDLRGFYDTVDDAYDAWAMGEARYDLCQIVATATWEKVTEGKRIL